MPYYPLRSEIPPYYCPVHKAWYKHGDMTCLVYHPPGTCCHEYEQQVIEPPQLETYVKPDCIGCGRTHVHVRGLVELFKEIQK